MFINVIMTAIFQVQIMAGCVSHGTLNAICVLMSPDTAFCRAAACVISFWLMTEYILMINIA